MPDIEQIYKEYARQVYKYLFSLCHNEQMAEELMQETFYRAIKSLQTYDGTCKIYVWLCQIAKHSVEENLILGEEGNKKS